MKKNRCEQREGKRENLTTPDLQESVASSCGRD